MLIDWFTVGAQVLNFLILVWLMKRFLYKPILHAIDAREKRIASELADADAKRAEAQKDREEFQHKNAEFDRQRAALLNKATDEANAERQRLLDEARLAAETLRAKRQDTLMREYLNLNDEITRRTHEEVFAIARKTLTDLAGASLEESMSEAFTCRLRALSKETKERLANALKTSSEPALVRSAFDLTPDLQAAIQNAINESFSADIDVHFETKSAIIGGIELIANGRKIAWSIEDYLTALQKDVGELLKAPSAPQDPPVSPLNVKAGPRQESGTESATPEEVK